jgi:hypothetical protein
MQYTEKTEKGDESVTALIPAYADTFWVLIRANKEKSSHKLTGLCGKLMDTFPML